MFDQPAETETPTDLRPVARSSRLRFSLRGIFIFVLGLAVALAYRRVPNVGWFDTILAASACWIGVGLIQEIKNTWCFWQQNQHLPSELQWGFAAELSRQLSAALMIVAGATFLLIRQTQEYDPNRDFNFDWTLANLAWTIFFFGIVVAYAPQSDSKPVNRTTSALSWSTAFDWIAVALGAYWLVHMLTSQMAITGLVHLAIRGVESYQPLRWVNEPFYPANLHTELSRQFVNRSVLAAVLVAIALGSTLLVNRYWEAPKMRLAWLVLAIASIGCAALLAWWAWSAAYPVLSPFLAQQTFIQPPINWIAGLTLMVGAALALTCRITPRPVEAKKAVFASSRRDTLQYSLPVMILFLVPTSAVCLQHESLMTEVRRAIGGSSPSFVEWLWGYLSGVFDTMVSDPRIVMQLASVIVVGRQAWHKWRGKPVQIAAVSAVNPFQFCVVTSLSALCLVLAVPVAGWLGFVLVVYAPLLGL